MPSPSSDEFDFLAEYVKESEWAAAHGVSQRTVKRYRDQGLAFLDHGGFIWIPRREGREWLESRVKRRHPPRRRRQAAASPAEIGAP